MKNMKEELNMKSSTNVNIATNNIEEDRKMNTITNMANVSTNKTILNRIIANQVAKYDGLTVKQFGDLNFKLTHYDFVTGEVTTEHHACNMAFTYAALHGYDPEAEFIYVTSEINKKDAEKLLSWQQTCGTFLTFSGIDYAPLCLTSSGGKQCQTIWCNKEHLKEYSRAFRMELGKKGFKMEPNKLFTRMGLFFSSAKPLNFNIDPNKISVVTDIVRDGVNRSDGFMIIFVDSEEEERKLRHAFTLRPLKGLVVVVRRYRLIELVGDRTIETIFGSTTNIANTQVLAFESTFKFASMKETEAQFAKQIADKGLFMAVNMNKHDKKWLTYQPLHTLNFSLENVTRLANANIEATNGLAKFANYIKLCPGKMREAIAIYPALSKDRYAEHEAQKAYRKFRMTQRGGALYNAGSFKAICPDFVDLFGVSNLKAGECCCNALPEGKLILIRYPHTGKESFVILNNRHIDMGIVDPHVLVLNNYDDSAARLGGADFDGDKVLVIENELYADIIMDTLAHEDIQHIEAPEGLAVKKEFNAKTADYLKKTFFGGLTNKNKIGQYANKLAKAFALSYAATTDEEYEKANAYIEYWTKMVLIEVDKEKHGSTFVEAPEGAWDIGTLPMFIKYAKVAKHLGDNSKFEIDNDAYSENMYCPMEQYSKMVELNTAEMKNFHVEIEDDFDWTKLLIDSERKLSLPEKMFKANTVVKNADGSSVKNANGKDVYRGGGWLDRIVYADSAKINHWAEQKDIDTDGTVDDVRARVLKITLSKLGEEFGMTEDEVYDATVAYIYGVVEPKMGDKCEAYKRAFWAAYAEEATNALADKFGEAAFDVKELEDIDAEYADEGEDEEMPW